LTLIVPRRAGVAAASAGGQDTIGLRCPSHPVALALLQALPPHAAGASGGLSGPSANRFGRVSPTTAAHVQAEFGDSLLVLDGGPCDVGIESTIIDCTRGVPVLLRPGAITRDQVAAACGQPVRSQQELDAEMPDRAACVGTLEAHYAPTARVRLMDAAALQTALDLLGEVMYPQGAQTRASIAVYARSPLKRVPLSVVLRRMPDDAAATAHQLFAALRGFDDAGVKLIWVETPPQTLEWDGVRDRLTRASAA
jgi:L-threonylcarbamoyladenylate synthase